MEVVYPLCCGLDVHKRNITACVITPRERELRSFGTMTEDLLALGDWLASKEVTHVAMEGTGSFWKPVYNLLEGAFEVLVVNAHHIKAVPGRKTDLKDAEWIASLLRHGLLKASYIPSRDQRELRELVRYRKSIIRERSSELNRIQKVLEGANIKLASVASDVLGRSGRAMLEAMVTGTRDPKVLARLAQGKLRAKQADLEKALTGMVGDHQRMILEAQLRHVDFLDEEIKLLSAEIARRLAPFVEALERLDTIPGVGRQTAEAIVAEIGMDMSRFPSSDHLASWAGMCPGLNESAGKRKSGRTRKGSPWLRECLVEAGRAGARTRGTYLGAQYKRIAARRGANRAAMAVGHTILVIVYHILHLPGTVYKELGADYFDRRNKETTARRAVKRLERLGYRVTLETAS